MEVRFNKNVFFSNETAAASVTIDNRLCGLKILEVEFRVLQKVRMVIHSSSFVFTPVPLSFKRPVDIPARFTEQKTLDFQLNF